jgi:hypothetical protein
LVASSKTSSAASVGIPESSRTERFQRESRQEENLALLGRGRSYASPRERGIIVL